MEVHDPEHITIQAVRPDEPTMSSASEVPSGLVNLAEDALGAQVLWVTDDFFAAKERMLGRAEPISRLGSFDEHGQWMDGWESRRRRGGGNDVAIIKLALRGVIRL